MDTPSILSSLSPLIAIVSSPDVDAICSKNGLNNLAEVLRPFEKGLERVSLRTSQLATLTAPTFPLRFTTLDALERAPVHSPATDQTDLVLDAIGAIISKSAKKWEEEVEVERVEGVEGVGERYLGKSIETLTPWYATFRDVVLKTRPVSEHETFNHPVAVILAISSSNRDPMNAMAKLYDRLNQSKFYGQRPFMDPSVLRYFVVVHDVGGGVDLEEAQKLLSSIKRTYGLHCTLLPLNSLSPTLPSSPFLHQLYSNLPPSDPTTVLTNTHPPPSPIDPPSTPVPVPAPSPKKTKRAEGEDHPLGLGNEQEQEQEEEEEEEKGKEGGEEEGEVWLGGRLTDVDVGSLRGFVREMAVKSLVPFMEKKVGEWNELFASSRRGLTGRLFGAGRKFFGSSRPASPAAGGGGSGTGGLAGFNVSKGYYPHQSAEATSRRLADFAFVLRDYRFAASVYDSIRKDYAADKAYRYQAGANEMFGLSIIMTTPPRTRLDVDPFLEQAVLTYQSRGTLQLDAMRSTLLYYEGYRTIGEWRSMGPALLRAAGEAEEIPSAILLEQAALADLRLPRPAMRRYAFHLVMAAQRYEKCGQKSFSRRCLEQSILLYRKQTWTRAQTHVEHALGRQAYTMGESDLAVNHFVRLLKGEQGAFLEDFVLAFEHLSTQNPEKIATLSDELPQPVFDQKRTSIRSLNGTSSHKGTDPKWAELQERFLEVGYPLSNGGESSSSRRKPRELLYSGGENIMSVDEPFLIELVAHNPLDASLSLGNVTVEAVVVSNDHSLPKVVPEGIEIEVVPEILLEPGETRRISLTVKASTIQTIEFTHVIFAFHKLLPCRQPLVRRGKRLHATKAQRLTPTYAPDTSLDVSIRPPRPNLAVSLDGLPLALGQGESSTVMIEVRNTGGAALRDLRVLVSDPSVLSVGGENGDGGSSSKASGSSSRLSIPNELFVTRPSEVDLPNGALQPGETLSLSVLCHGQYLGAEELLLLFVYETCDESSTTFSSTIAHTLNVEPVVQVHANHRPSSSRPGNHLLALEVESFSSDPVRISHVSALSPLWEISSPGGRSSASNFLLSTNQSHRSFLTISPSSPDPTSPRQDMQFTATKLQRLLAGSSVKPSLPSSINLLLSPPPETDSSSSLPPLLLTSKRDSRLSFLSSQYPLIPPSDLPHIFPLFEPRDLDILLFWEIPSQSRSGYLLVSGMTPGPSESIFLGLEVDGGKGERVVRSMFEATDTAKKALASSVLGGRLGLEEDPVRVSVVGGEQVGWDFGNGPCLVPVTFSIANTSTTLSTKITFSIQEPPPTSLLQPSFAGSLSHQAIIPPSSSSLFNASFVAARPGIYNVAGWHLAVETGQETSVVDAGEGDEDGWKGRKWFEQVPREEKRVKVLEESPTTARRKEEGEGLVTVEA